MAKEMDAAAIEKKRLSEEKKKLKAEQKRQKKEAKLRAKEIEAKEAELTRDDEGGGFMTVLATLLIIAVWIAILCVVIKLDIGGFGSGVLTPLLKDVPVINKILPNPKGDESTLPESGYSNMNDALEEIRLLESQLQQAQLDNLHLSEENENLKAENVRLQQFEDKQVEFQRIKTEFFESVVYAENGPGAEEYKKYYEAMDPATAEYLYKQVVAQLEEDEEIQNYALAYSTMKPKNAAKIFEQMTDNLNLVARILGAMNAESRGAILAAMDPEIAARITKIMDPES